MQLDSRQFSFEAISADSGQVYHHEFHVVALSQAQAWEIATGQAQAAAIQKRQILVAMSYLGWVEISEPVPFEEPYIIDSPLWSTEYSHPN